MSGWYLPRDTLNEVQIASIKKFLAHAKQANEIDCKVRKDGVETFYELDWIKHLAAARIRLVFDLGSSAEAEEASAKDD